MNPIGFRFSGMKLRTLAPPEVDKKTNETVPGYLLVDLDGEHIGKYPNLSRGYGRDLVGLWVRDGGQGCNRSVGMLACVHDQIRTREEIQEAAQFLAEAPQYIPQLTPDVVKYYSDALTIQNQEIRAGRVRKY